MKFPRNGVNLYKINKVFITKTFVFNQKKKKNSDFDFKKKNKHVGNLAQHSK